MPESFIERWFGELENFGFDELLSDNICPDEYKSSKWWDKNV